MSDLKLISWNINGIRTRFKNGDLDEIFNLSPDILLFQETKANYSQIDTKLIDIDDFNSYFEIGENTRTGGIANFTKEKPKFIKRYLSSPLEDLDNRVFLSVYEKFTLINLLLPTGNESKEKLTLKLDLLKKVVEFAKGNSNKNLIIAGDFNISKTELDSSKVEDKPGFLYEEVDLLNDLEQAGFIDTFRLLNNDSKTFTSFKSQKARDSDEGNRVDYFFISKSLKDNLKEANILSDISGSKHAPIELVLNI